MNARKRLLTLALTMSTVCLLVIGTAMVLLYWAAFEEKRQDLVENAERQARFIEAVARFDAVHSQEDDPEGAAGATLSQVLDAHTHVREARDAAEAVLAKREGDRIVFLMTHRGGTMETPQPVPFDSELAEPMRRALSGKSGTLVGLDYDGRRVLAAHAPVGVHGWGLVMKFDLATVRAPFLVGGGLAVALSLVLAFLAAVLFARFTNPMIRQLEESEARTRAIVDTAVDGIITIQATGIVQSFNPAAERIFGYAAEPILKKLEKKRGEAVVPAEGFFVGGTEGPLDEGELERATAWAQEIAGRAE